MPAQKKKQKEEALLTGGRARLLFSNMSKEAKGNYKLSGSLPKNDHTFQGRSFFGNDKENHSNHISLNMLKGILSQTSLHYQPMTLPSRSLKWIAIRVLDRCL